MSAARKLTIAQVSPRRLDSRHEIAEYVGRTSSALAERGHRVLVAAPSDSRTALREGRRAIKAAVEDPRSLFREENSKLLAIGQSLPLPSGPRRRPPPIPLDVSRALEQLLEAAPFDIVHVHEPFAPSAGSAALRHSLSLNVATFHEPAERVLSTQVARMLVEMFFGRIDARTASNVATAEMLESFFPGRWEVVRAGADVAEPALDPPPPGRIRIVHAAEEERGALRLFLRALRRLPEELDWEGVVWFDGPTDPLARVSRRLRERLRVVRPVATASPRASSPAPTSSASPREGCGRRPGSPARRSPPERCRSSPTSSCTASWSATASAGCCSRSETRSPWRPSSSASAPTRSCAGS